MNRAVRSPRRRQRRWLVRSTSLATASNSPHLLKKTDRLPEALVVMRQAIVGRETSLADAPDDPERQRDLAYSNTVLAGVLDGLNRFDEADATYRKAFDRFEDLARRFPSVPNHRAQAAAIAANRGRLLTLLLRYGEAEAAYRVAIDLSDRLARDFPRQPEIAELTLAAHHGFATMLQGQGRQREAEEEYRKILPIKRRLAAEFPDVPNLQISLSETLGNLATDLDEQGKKAAAESAYREAVEIDRRLVARIPRQPSLRKDLAYQLTNFGSILGDHPPGRDEAIDPLSRGDRRAGRVGRRVPREPRVQCHPGERPQQLRWPVEEDGASRRGRGPVSPVDRRLGQARRRVPGLARVRDRAGGHVREPRPLHPRTGPPSGRTRVVRQRDRLARRDPEEVPGRCGLPADICATITARRAYALGDLGRHAEAAKDWRSALELSDPPMAPKYRLGEAVSLARGDGRHERALKLAEDSAAEEGIDA